MQKIPDGVDHVLDDYRESSSGDPTFTTSIKRQVRAFMLYRRYAETGRRFLDWGCRHAWDACMVRIVNPDATIDGCDISQTMTDATNASRGCTTRRSTIRGGFRTTTRRSIALSAAACSSTCRFRRRRCAS